jgi:uncharacterized RDD family membrane protein YckC
MEPFTPPSQQGGGAAAAAPAPPYEGAQTSVATDVLVELPPGVVLSSKAKRFGENFLEGLLLLCTAGIGWLIWAFIVFERGQTPAKQILGMRVVSTSTGRRATWGRMFVREILLKLAPAVALWLAARSSSAGGAVVLFQLLFLVYEGILLVDRKRQAGWDKLARTVVVDDPENRV